MDGLLVETGAFRQGLQADGQTVKHETLTEPTRKTYFRRRFIYSFNEIQLAQVELNKGDCIHDCDYILR